MIMNEKLESKIIRLNNGEDVIAKIIKSDKRNITLSKPFIFRTQSVIDPRSGIKKDVTMLQSWLSFVDSDEITIGQDNVLAFLSPTGETEKLYDIEKEREEHLKKQRNVINYNDEETKPTKPTKHPNDDIIGKNTMNPDVESTMKKLYDDLADQLDGVDGLDELDEDEMQEFIVMTLMIPPDILKKMISEGIIKPEQMSEFLFDNMNAEKTTEEYTGDDENHPDFGNRLTDWSSDTDEYLN